jgi:hypothetical protein
MICCAYCDEPATRKIPSNPEDVCNAHALEFWTGLLAYVHDRSERCVKHEGFCTCRACTDSSAADRRASAVAAADQRASAVAAAGPPPSETERFPIQRAS